MIHSNLKKRLKDLQKAAGIEKGKRLRTWVFYSDNDEGKAAEMEKIKAGKVRQKDGGTYSEEDANFFIDVRYCPGGVAPGDDLPAVNIPVEENTVIAETEETEETGRQKPGEYQRSTEVTVAPTLAELEKEVEELEARIKKLKG